MKMDLKDIINDSVIVVTGENPKLKKTHELVFVFENGSEILISDVFNNAAELPLRFEGADKEKATLVFKNPETKKISGFVIKPV